MAIVENTNPRIQYQGPTDIDAVLFIDFPYNKKADVKCWIDEEPLQYNVDYTVEESNVTLKVPVEAGKLITLFRDTPLDQQGNFPQNSRFNSQELDDALDKLCMQQQEQAEAINRSMKASIVAMNFNGSIPAPRPGRALKINDEGTGFALSDFDPDEAMTITEDFKKAAEDAANHSESIQQEVEQLASEVEQQVIRVEGLVQQGEENINEVINKGSELIQIGQQTQSDIINTGIDTRATIDLDNITDKARQDIQYQAKLANAPFCANSGNVDENGNADLLYLPESGFTEVYWQNPVITSLTEYGTLSGAGWSNILQAFDGSTALQWISVGTTTVDWTFPIDKRIFLNKLRIYWGGQGSVSGSAYSAYLELYKDGVTLTRITITPGWSGWQDITFDKTECDRVYLYIDGYNLSDVPTRIGEVQFVGTEIIPISTSTQAFFKIGGNYPNLVATDTEKTFEKSYLQPVNIEDIDLPYKGRYTLIGALSDNDGLIKGFTTTSYAQIPMTIPFSIADNFEVVTKFTYKETSGIQQTIVAEHNTPYFSGFGINADGYINLYLGNSTHTGKFIEANSAYTPIEEHSYNLKFTFDGTTYRVFIKEESDTEFEEIITEESTEKLADFIWNIGCSGYSGYYQPFAGVIDLKETYIKINEQIIWDNLGGAFNVFINDTQQPYTLANNIYIQKSKPKSKFVQPILIENGVMGGDSFAVSSNVEVNENNACKAFDGSKTDTAYFHTPSGVKTGYYDIYNPIALNITKLKFYNQVSAANRASSAGNIYGSHNGEEWVLIKSYTNTVQAKASTWEIDLSSNKDYYKYYRIESTAGSSDNYWVIVEIEITATEEIPPVDTVWLDTSVQPYKAYKFNGIEWEDFKDVPVGSFVIENRSISSVETFDYNLTFKKVTSDAPSYKYNDLMLGADSTTYTAPDNGWYYINKIAGGAEKYINIFVNGDSHETCEYCGSIQATYSSTTLVLLVKVKKNDTILVNYSASGALHAFRFIYAEGAK